MLAVNVISIIKSNILVNIFLLTLWTFTLWFQADLRSLFTKRRKTCTVHNLGPWVASKVLHDRLTAAPRFLADFSARRNLAIHVDNTGGHIQHAQKELKCRGTLEFYQRRKYLDLWLGYLLRFMAEKVGHPNKAVAEIMTHTGVIEWFTLFRDLYWFHDYNNKSQNKKKT